MRTAAPSAAIAIVLAPGNCLPAEAEPIGFGEPLVIAIPEPSPALAFARFDIESGYDLLSLLPQSGRLALHKNNQQSFGDAQIFAAIANPDTLAVGEFTGDEFLDAVVATSASDRLAVARYEFPGAFTVIDRPRAAAATIGIVAGDIDGDGDNDIVAAGAENNLLTILFNRGDGVFEQSTSVFSASMPVGVDLGDIDNDGDTDLLSCNYLADTITVHRNDGHGEFSFLAVHPVGSRPRDVLTGHFNGDNALDIIAINQNAGSISFLAGQGNGEFGPAITLPAGSQPVDAERLDVDGDGDDDAVVALSRQENFVILRNTVSGPVTQVFDIDGFQSNVAAGDFNQDGMPDLAFVSPAQKRIWVVPNITTPPPKETPTACPADCDRNRRVDFSDLTCALGDFGLSGFEAARADCDDSGAVDFGDLICVLNSFGPCDARSQNHGAKP